MYQQLNKVEAFPAQSTYTHSLSLGVSDRVFRSSLCSLEAQIAEDVVYQLADNFMTEVGGEHNQLSTRLPITQTERVVPTEITLSKTRLVSG